MAPQRPLHVFAHQRRRMIGPRPQRRDHALAAPGVAQRHRQVAQPARVADAADRRSGMAFVELNLAPREQFDQPRVVQPVPHLEVGQRAHARELVPRTGKLAVVAAVDAVADQRPQLGRDRAGVLDRQVADAAPRVEPVRSTPFDATPFSVDDFRISVDGLRECINLIAIGEKVTE